MDSKVINKKSILSILLIFLIAWTLSQAAYATIFPAPARGEDIIGDLYSVLIEPGDTMSAIAKRYNVSVKDIQRANPHVDPLKMKVWSEIMVPSAYVLPNVPRRGIVINLAEMRLYYFPPDQNSVFTAPVGIGREGWATPLGRTRIIEKIEQPTWHVPKSIQEASKKKGIILPDVVPPGPENPLGDYAMRLGKHSYLIHGTNAPITVGQRSSSGCIRMYPWDVDVLFYMVEKGTPVNIINQPIKVGRYKGELYLEVHPTSDFPEVEYDIGAYERFLRRLNQNYTIQWDYVRQISGQQLGFPRLIGWERRGVW